MAEKTRIVAMVTFDVVTEDEDELDAVCEEVHEQFGIMMTSNDWTGSVELSWSSVDD